MSDNKTVTFDAIRDIRDLITDLYAYAAQHDDRNILESRVLAVYDVIDNAKCEQPAAQSAGQEAVGVAGTMPGTDGFTMACFKADEVPVGTQLYAAPVNGGERVQWWLADIDMHGNPTLSDGAHSDRAGADKAAYLHAALGLKRDRKFAVARVELFEPKPNAEGVNHEAVSQCNAMSERAADAQQAAVKDKVTADDVRRWAQIAGIKLADSDEVVMRLAEFAIFARAALMSPAKEQK